MDYEDSNRYKILKLCREVMYVRKTKLPEISISIGRTRGFLSTTCSEKRFKDCGDLSEKTYLELVAVISQKYNLKLEAPSKCDLENVKFSDYSYDELVILQAALIILDKKKPH